MKKILLDKEMINKTLDRLKCDGGIITKFSTIDSYRPKKYSTVYEDEKRTNIIFSIDNSVISCGKSEDSINYNPAGIYINYTNDQEESVSISIRSINGNFTEIEKENIVKLAKSISIKSSFCNSQDTADLIYNMKQHNAIINQIEINENLSLFTSIIFYAYFPGNGTFNMSQVSMPEKYIIVQSEVDYKNMILNKYYYTIEESQESYKDICKIPIKMSIYSEIDTSNIPIFYYQCKVNIKLFVPIDDNDVFIYNDNYIHYITDDYSRWRNKAKYYSWKDAKYLSTEDVEIVVNKPCNKIK